MFWTLCYEAHIRHTLSSHPLYARPTNKWHTTHYTHMLRSFHPSFSFVLSYGCYAIPTIYHKRFRSIVQSFNRSRSFFHTDITQSLLFTTNDFVESFNRSRSSFRTHTPRRGVRHMYVLCMSVAVAPCAGASDISLIKDLSGLPPRVDLDALL